MRMKIKDYFIAAGISIGAAILTTFILWLTSILSWSIITISLIVIFIPIVIKAIEFYKEKDCIDLEDFIDELKKLNKDKEKKNSKIE